MAQIPPAEAGRICPFHQKDMSKVCHKCPLWTQVRGKHPQTGEEMDNWNCSFALLPVLLIDNSRQSRSTAAAVESFRNEMVDANERSAAVVANMLAIGSVPTQAPKLIGGD